jgi:hypothetical protein
VSLYKSASGREVNHASSSSIDTFRLCRRKFKLSRIDGYRQKDKKASLEFGKCVEAGVQYYHDNGLKPDDGVAEFTRLWVKFIDQPLSYTDQEGNWKSLNTMGKEMLRLYEIKLPELPIKNPKWQLQFLKSLWPGTDLADLQFMAYVDLLSTLDDGSRIIIDIKTAKAPLDVTPGMMALDGQLRKYAWVSGIRDVGFLNFVKAEPEGFKKGSRVTLLEDCASWHAGDQLTVVKFQAPKESIEVSGGVKMAPVPWLMLVATDETVQKMDEEIEKISGKGATEKKEAVVSTYLSSGTLGSVTRESITKTRLQFVRGIIPEEELAEIGQQIGGDVFALKNAHDTGAYPKDGGVRFPNAICGWCEMRGICLKDDKLRDDILVQIGAKEEEKDWLSEMEEDSE